MAKILIQPIGEVPNPETAYAEMKTFIKEDLYLSVSCFFYCDCDHRFNKFVHPVTAARGEVSGGARKSGLRTVPDWDPQ